MDTFDMAIEKVRTCYEKEAPFCADQCPFHLDVREFALRLRRGSVNSAFRTFSNGVGFPGLVARLCPGYCQQACPRGKTDTPIRLPLMEQAVYRLVSNRRPNSYNLPAKEGRFAIIGAGVSGLGCALRLCNKKYQVTVFEQEARIGGHLLQILPAEEVEDLLNREFVYERYTLRCGEAVQDPRVLLKPAGEFDAVYIATGAGGDDFGLQPLADGAAPFATDTPGLFLGGSLLGADTMHALAQGMTAATVLESYYKTGEMKSAPALRPTRMVLDETILTPQEGPQPTALEGGFTKEEAIAEAKRCLICRCDACYRHCPMFGYFEKFPLRLMEEVRMTIHPVTLDHDGTVATRLISTCSQCGLCTELCPQHIDMGSFFLTAHRLMRERKSWPWGFHAMYLRDLAFARSDAAALLASPVERPKYLYFPGCQIGASDPALVRGSYALLRQILPDTAISLGCCGAPAVWAGEVALQEEVFADIRAQWQRLGQPKMVLACPSCGEMFRQYLPEIPTVFLLDLLAEHGLRPAKSVEGTAAAVFDPCAMRHQPSSRAAARQLAEAAGYQLSELSYHGERAQCCSYGGQIGMTNPPYTEWLVQQRVSESDLPYLVYCVNCRDAFTAAGKEAKHILELYPGCARTTMPAPSWEQRLQNRRELKKQMIEAYFPAMGDAMPPEPALPKLVLDDGLADKLAQEHILLQDVATVIQACEADHRRVTKPNGHFCGYREIGPYTCWVEYHLLPDGGYAVHNAYLHRMKIEIEEHYRAE